MARIALAVRLWLQMTGLCGVDMTIKHVTCSCNKKKPFSYDDACKSRSAMFMYNCDTIINMNVLPIEMSCRLGKPTVCKGLNKGTDNCKADQRHCFRYTNSAIPLLSKSKTSSL